MKASWRSTSASACVAAFVLSTTATAQTWHVEVLPDVPGYRPSLAPNGPSAVGIDAQGRVVAEFYMNDNPSVSVPGIWEAGEWHILPTTGGQTRAIGVTPKGVVYGLRWLPGQQCNDGGYWVNGVWQSVARHDGGATRSVHGMNDSLQGVGIPAPCTGPARYIDGTVMRESNLPSTLSSISARLNGNSRMNAHGRAIVGSFLGGGFGVDNVAIINSDGTMYFPAAPTGTSGPQIDDINDHDLVLMRDLRLIANGVEVGVIPNFLGQRKRLTNRGEVLAQSNLFDGTITIPLTTLVPPSLGFLGVDGVDMNDRGQIVAHALRAGFTGHQIIILTPPPSPGSVAGSGFGEGQPGIGLSGWTPWSPYIPPDRPRVRPWPMPPQDPEDPQLSPNGVARFDQGTPAAITQHADMPTGGGLIRLRYLFLDAGTHEPGNPARVQLLIDGHIIATAVAPETPADTFADLVGQVPQNFAGVNGALLEIRVTGPQDLDLLIDDVEFVLAVSNPQDATRCPGESVEFTLDLAIGQAASFEW